MFSACAALVVATYLSALSLALHRKRRSRIALRFEQRGAGELGEYLTTRRHDILLVLTLLRTTARVSVFALILVAYTGLGESVALTLQTLLIAAGITIAALWLSSSVLALAVAEHAGVGLVFHSARLLQLAAILGHPLGKALSFLDESVRRLSGAHPEGAAAIQDELLRSIEETHREGGLEPEAVEMLENIVEFRSAEVSEIMTPRTDIEGIEMTDDLTVIRTFFARAGHSRIPVYEGSLDSILGILYVKDLIDYLGEDASGFTLANVLRKPIVVPESKPVPQLLAEFQRSEVHMAIVIDEYGGTSGLVTIEDVLEEIVGEIHDEHEPVDDEEPQLHEVSPDRAEVDGRFSVCDLNDRLGLGLPEDGDFETIAGFVMTHLGRVPSKGESFESHAARFTTLAATSTHVQRIAIERLTEPGQNGDAGTATSTPPK
ncbi:MAG: hemolysin family protein [Phycisphaerales bacterium]